MTLSKSKSNKFQNMPDLNEIKNQVCEESINEKVKYVTIDILKKNQFETTQEYYHRISDLKYFRIGTAILKKYDADNEKIWVQLERDEELYNFKGL